MTRRAKPRDRRRIRRQPVRSGTVMEDGEEIHAMGDFNRVGG